MAVTRLRLALGLALALLAPGLTAAEGASGAVRSSRVPTIYHKSRSFRIPFSIERADRPRLKEVQLWVSEDSGYSWKPVSMTTPDRPAFTFRAARDAEYWFAVRTVDVKGQLFPGEEEKVEPSMKVVVDTAPPRLVIEPDGRRGSLAAVRWEARDEHLDLKSLVLEYQVEGGRDWRQVPIRPMLLGQANWDAGTAAPLKVRASVVDKANNLTEATITLPEGTPSNPGVSSNDSGDSTSVPPVSQISSGPTFPPADESPRGAAAPATSTASEAAPFPFPSASAEPPATAPASASASAGPDLPSFAGETDPFGGGASEAPAGANAQAPPHSAPQAAGNVPTLLVSKPQFPLKYAVEDAGPSGPATVELWVTQDGGRTWFPKGTDPDCASPFPVDLGGEGTFGLRIVSLAASGLGDQRPGPGEPPDMLVEVDSTAPTVQVLPTRVGTGANLGKIAVRWTASDAHLAPKPVVISWRAEQAGSPWQPITPEPIANTGTFTWNVPANVPPRFHLRVDAIDTANNRGWAETTEGPPVYVDRTRPRSRIIGLDPSARTGTGPATRAVR